MLADGYVVESGTHEELMAVGGTYAELFTLQASPDQYGRAAAKGLRLVRPGVFRAGHLTPCTRSTQNTLLCPVGELP